jgi:hypothetical protein
MDLEEKILVGLSSISIAIIVIYSIYDYAKKRKISYNILEKQVDKKESPKQKTEKSPIKNIRRQAGLSSSN